MKRIAVIVVSERALGLAQTIQREIEGVEIYCRGGHPDCHPMERVGDVVGDLFGKMDGLVFIGAMGITIRAIAPYLEDKHHDPAVVNVDSQGRYAVSLLSGHVGGANALATRVARILGAEEVISTQSDREGLWALDILGERFGWTLESNRSSYNEAIALFVDRRPTALLLECRDEGTAYLERTKPEHVTIFDKYEEVDFQKFQVLLAVSPRLYPSCPLPLLSYYPPLLELGVGCRRDASPEGVVPYIGQKLQELGYAPAAVAGVNTIDLKKDEPLLHQLAAHYQVPLRIFTSEDLAEVTVPNPSQKVADTTGSYSVSEASALKASGVGALLLVEKQKGRLREGSDFTFALAMQGNKMRRGHIEIVGAGPGDPELVSVKGKHFLEQADLILYAGSLVPIELTHYAKPGATVRSSADMALEEQFELMAQFYKQGKLIVRLHTGDPCIYGAIQEQMALFDEHQMSYHITPGISSFQAAAAALRSQFTIPEKVQTIILTRGEGRTPMPEKEKLHMLAASQSTMCIFLSATLADKVQRELLVHYPPTTPVAVCHKLTWKDEQIYRGELQHLAQIIKEHRLTLTTMIVVGEAIDNRAGLSRLYADEFKHIYRK